jgi:hypothetical protein
LLGITSQVLSPLFKDRTAISQQLLDEFLPLHERPKMLGAGQCLVAGRAADHQILALVPTVSSAANHVVALRGPE